jgi:hypothetical protein
MSTGPRCFVIVPNTTPDLHTRLASAFADDARVFVLRDRRTDDKAITKVGIFAVGGGALDPALRRAVEDKLRALGVA